MRWPPLQVSGMSEGIYELHGNPQERARVLEEATDRAKQRAIVAGAAPRGCQVCKGHHDTCKINYRALREQKVGLQSANIFLHGGFRGPLHMMLI